MLNSQKLIIDTFADGLEATYRRTYGTVNAEYGSILGWGGRLVLENISNSDMLYHDVEHTMLVTTAGQQILIGRHLREGGVTPLDWLHFTLALLCHDIGYVKGVCRSDTQKRFATGEGDATVELPEGSTDAALTPYHVSRSQLFVRERSWRAGIAGFDPEIIASYIEMTRFPPPQTPAYQETGTYGGLARAADFIGQLGDPNYLRKIPALFYEFEELGSNAKLGYRTPGDMRNGFAGFFWNVVSPYIQDGLRYLRVTVEGRQWIANLNSHVFEVEHRDT